MPRPPSLNPKVRLEVQLPPDLMAHLALSLYSSVEERVPHGRYSEFVTESLRDRLFHSTLDLSRFGFPQGYFVRGPKAVIAALESSLITVTEGIPCA